MSNINTPFLEIQSVLKELSVGRKEADREIKELRAFQKETARQMKETDRRLKETDRLIKENARQMKEMREENARQMKEMREENARKTKEMREENARKTKEMRKETDRWIKKLDRQIQKVGGRFNERWGRFVESLVEGKLLQLLQAWRITVDQLFSNVRLSMKKEDGSVAEHEFDIIAVNGTEVVAGEVKTVLTPKKVDQFIEVLKDFESYFPYCKGKKLYAAVAYLRSEDGAGDFAEKKGLFVIKATGDSARIVNKKGFQPKVFS